MLHLIIILVFTFLFTGIVIAITPYISRKETVFGILIPGEKADDPLILGAKKNYFMATMLLSVLMCIPFLVFYGADEEMMNVMAIYIVVALIAYCIIAYAIYYMYHKKIKAFKETIPHDEYVVECQKIVVSTDFNKQNTVVSNGVFAVTNILLIMITIVIPIFFYDIIPNQVPTHWGPGGNVTTYREKSIGIFLVLPFIQLIILAIMLVSNHGIKMAKQKLNVKKPQVSRAQNIAFRYAMSKFLFITAIACTALMLAIQCFMVFNLQDGNIIMILTGIMIVPIIVGSLYIAIRYGQGGERLKIDESEVQIKTGDSYDDDKFWIAGLFYYNPKDSAVWVEKRFGIGMTLNFGSPLGILIIVGILLATVLMVVLPFILGM